MLSLCPRCHAKVHRTKAVFSARPPLLLELWREKHPKAHEQVQLDFAVLLAKGEAQALIVIRLPGDHTASPRAKDEGARALQPTRLTVATEDYPLSRRLYPYTPENPTNKLTRKFVEFALSHQGEDVIGTSGFVAQRVTPQAEIIDASAPSEYKQLTSGAQRLSLDFRFKTGKGGVGVDGLYGAGIF